MLGLMGLSSCGRLLLLLIGVCFHWVVSASAVKGEGSKVELAKRGEIICFKTVSFLLYVS